MFFRELIKITLTAKELKDFLLEQMRTPVFPRYGRGSLFPPFSRYAEYDRLVAQKEKIEREYWENYFDKITGH
jgi:hypothetical protein